MNARYRLRPMDLRDILDETFDLYKDNFSLFVLITAVVYLPFQILLGIVQAQFGAAAQNPDRADLAAMIPLGIAFIVLGILTILAMQVATGALSAAISERYLGRTITLRESYEVILSRFGPFIGTLFLSFLAMAGGAFLIFVVPVALLVGISAAAPIVGGLLAVLLILPLIVGILFFVFLFTFVIPVFVLEGRAGGEAIRSSFELFRFSPMKAFFTLFLVFLLIGFLSALLTIPVAILTQILSGGGPASPFLTLLNAALSGIAQTLAQPIYLIVTVLLYYDIRIRREGFDLEVMASELRGGASPYPAEETVNEWDAGDAPPPASGV